MSMRRRPGVKLKLYTGGGGWDKECDEYQRDQIERRIRCVSHAGIYINRHEHLSPTIYSINMAETGHAIAMR